MVPNHQPAYIWIEGQIWKIHQWSWRLSRGEIHRAFQRSYQCDSCGLEASRMNKWSISIWDCALAKKSGWTDRVSFQIFLWFMFDCQNSGKVSCICLSALRLKRSSVLLESDQRDLNRESRVQLSYWVPIASVPLVLILFLEVFGMGSFLICVVCCIWWEKIPRFMGIPLKAFHQKVMECHGSKRAVWIPHAVVILPGRSVIEIGISEADHSSWAKLRQLRSGWLSFVTFVHNNND